jgi:hypothetical protein
MIDKCLKSSRSISMRTLRSPRLWASEPGCPWFTYMEHADAVGEGVVDLPCAFNWR